MSTERLRRRTEYRRVYDGGVKAPGRHVVLFARWQGSGSRVGITTTRRVGSAVLRNRARRRIRELARRYWRGIAALEADVVVNARQSCVSATWTELETDFGETLRRLEGKLRMSARSSVC